jgi:hypothetical protein
VAKIKNSDRDIKIENACVSRSSPALGRHFSLPSPLDGAHHGFAMEGASGRDRARLAFAGPAGAVGGRGGFAGPWGAVVLGRL